MVSTCSFRSCAGTEDEEDGIARAPENGAGARLKRLDNPSPAACFMSMMLSIRLEESLQRVSHPFVLVAETQSDKVDIGHATYTKSHPLHERRIRHAYNQLGP
eukprot:5266199-Prymnesium_polylepis.1